MKLENEFWHYSLSTYALPGVAEQALAWQNAEGLNVNILLWCTWLDQQGLGLHESGLTEVTDGVQEWDLTVVQALRGARGVLKSSRGEIFNQGAGTESLRKLIKQAERLIWPLRDQN